MIYLQDRVPQGNTVEKTDRLHMFVCCVHQSGPCMATLCGCLVAFSLDVPINRMVLVRNEMGKRAGKATQQLEKKVHLAPKARSQIYNIHLYKETALWFLFLIPSISPFPTSPLLPSLSSRSLTRTEECYPLVAGHPATRRQERRKREPQEFRDFYSWSPYL